MVLKNGLKEGRSGDPGTACISGPKREEQQTDRQTESRERESETDRQTKKDGQTYN